MHSLNDYRFLSLDIANKFTLFSGFRIFVSAGAFCTDFSPYEQERAIMTGAVIKRKIEFYSGRYYARQALLNSGSVAQAILRGRKGNPIWPEGIFGSITHDQEQAIAAVAYSSSTNGIGIDLVVDPMGVELNLMPLIASADELHCLAKAFPDVPPLALAFSLKEAVVKAVSPHIDDYMDMLDIRLISKNGYIEANLPTYGFCLRCQVFPFTTSIITLALLEV